VMIHNSEPLFKHSLYVDYEVDGLVEASSSYPVYCHLVPDLIWSEIDDTHHLNRARDSVYPKILKKDVDPFSNN